MLRPWAENGYICYCFDLNQENQHIERTGLGELHFIQLDVMDDSMVKIVSKLQPHFIFGFPPCTDVAVSGARHFEKKFSNDPYCQAKTADLAFRIPQLAQISRSIWAFENPKSMLKHYIGDPDYKFDPWEFGGYLSEDDVHPRWPDYIPPRDAYSKETWLWASPRFIFPPKAPVYCPPGWSPQTTRLGGKSKKTKQIRSETPRGFAKAVFLANRVKEN
jgi:hypothetical protein